MSEVENLKEYRWYNNVFIYPEHWYLIDVKYVVLNDPLGIGIQTTFEYAEEWIASTSSKSQQQLIENDKQKEGE